MDLTRTVALTSDYKEIERPKLDEVVPKPKGSPKLYYHVEPRGSDKFIIRYK